jgi:hypothetical protein
MLLQIVCDLEQVIDQIHDIRRLQIPEAIRFHAILPPFPLSRICRQASQAYQQRQAQSAKAERYVHNYVIDKHREHM